MKGYEIWWYTFRYSTHLTKFLESPGIVPLYLSLILCSPTYNQSYLPHRSEKLKPFWLSLESEHLPVLDFLASVLLGGEAGRGELEAALDRALSLPECRVVPFFGTFLADLMGILQATPSLVVLAEDGQEVEVGICVSVYLCMYCWGQ